jgi:hypothetical protein
LNWTFPGIIASPLLIRHGGTERLKREMAHRGLETECANSVAFRRWDEAFGQETNF